jgi:hypothetical protein
LSKSALWSNLPSAIAIFAIAFITFALVPKNLIAQNISPTSKSIELLHVGSEDASLFPETKIKIVQGHPEESAGTQIEVPEEAFIEVCQALQRAPHETQQVLRYGVFDALPTGCPLMPRTTKRIGPETFLNLMKLTHQPNAAGKYFPNTVATVEAMVREYNPSIKGNSQDIDPDKF